jgi:biopolymer transport protein ExbD
MTTSNGNSRDMTSEINVTPMIDVLLVLLIIFMVIVPAVPRGEAALAPKTALHNPKSDENAVVLEVFKGKGGEVGYRINQQPVARQDLPGRLAAIYANRAQRVLFVKGDDQLSFTQVAEAIDIGHAVGVDRIGLMTPKVQAGQ